VFGEGQVHSAPQGEEVVDKENALLNV